MAGEYDINLSNGSVLSTLYPLEVNGPDNESTPRLIKQARPTFPIVQIGAIAPNGVIKIAGDWTAYFPIGLQFDISGSTSNDGIYTVANLPVPGSVPLTNGAWYDIGQDETNIILTAALPSATADGDAGINAFVLNGDLTYRFTSGFSFVVQNSGGNDGTYTVSAFNSYLAGTVTVIQPTTTILGSALPNGEIQYTIFDSRTTLKLPGKGTLNYGEMIIENIVRMTEHFAADDEPEANANIGILPAAEPLTGQLWYNTTTGSEGFRFFDGTIWTNVFDFDDGALIFKDIEDGDKDVYVTASETNLPAPWPGGANNQPGFVFWSQANPASEEALVRVLSSDGAEQLRIEHDGRVETDGAIYVKNVTSYGDDNIFDGNLGIGGGTFDGSVVRTLTVEGDGIQVDADLANNAGVVLNAPAGMVSLVHFQLNSVLEGNITVNDATPGNPLEINSIVTNDVVMVTGGGNVGINEVTPSRQLDVVGESEFNGDVYIINSDATFYDSFGLESIAGALFKTSPGGETWQTTPATGTDASFVANDSGGTAIFVVDETNGTHIDQFNFFVDTDTLFVDVTNDYVGINKTPSYPLDVTGDTRVEGHVGINQVPPVTNVPVGTDIWLAVTGDIQANSQFLGADGSTVEPTYSFTNYTNMGLRARDAFTLEIVVGSTDIFQIQNSPATPGVTVFGTIFASDGTASQPSYGFASDTSTGMYLIPGVPGSLGFSTNNTESLRVGANGILSVQGTNNYETFIIDDDDVPNKKYVDDTINDAVAGSSWRQPVRVHDDTIYASVGAIPTAGTIQGETIATDMRVLFSQLPSINRDIYTFNGTAWVQDTIYPRSIGDTTYTEVGTYAGNIYSFDENDNWTLINGQENGANVDELVAGVGQTIFNTVNVATTAKTSTRAFQQVFVNGILQKEGATFAYTVTGANQITFNVAVPDNADVTIYAL